MILPMKSLKMGPDVFSGRHTESVEAMNNNFTDDVFREIVTLGNYNTVNSENFVIVLFTQNFA